MLFENDVFISNQKDYDFPLINAWRMNLTSIPAPNRFQLVANIRTLRIILPLIFRIEYRISPCEYSYHAFRIRSDLPNTQISHTRTCSTHPQTFTRLLHKYPLSVENWKYAAAEFIFSIFRACHSLYHCIDVACKRQYLFFSLIFTRNRKKRRIFFFGMAWMCMGILFCLKINC